MIRNTCMARFLGMSGKAFAVAFLLMGTSGASPARALDARVAASLEPSGTVWVGQKVILRVDLKSDGYSFRDQRIRLPEVPGVLLLEDAVETVKLSESIDGETWQVLRYEFPFFSQRAERLEIPPIEVEFAVTGDFGSEPEPFRLRTPKQVVTTQAPAGVKDVRRLVTTSDFSVRVELDPEPEDLRVGDAVTRRIERRAVDLTAMAFAPLATPDLPGIAVYEKAPEIEESRNRGEMVGTRIDTTTFVLQEAGSFVVPGFDLEWWDPDRRRLITERVPDLQLDVAANPLWSRAPGGLEEAGAGARTWIESHPWLAATLGLLAAAAAIGLYRSWPGIRLRLARWREARADRESTRFARLDRACRANDPVRAYNAFRGWLEHREEGAASDIHDETLSREVERMQAALVGRDPEWKGRALIEAARRARKHRASNLRASRPATLHDLNPSALRSNRFGPG